MTSNGTPHFFHFAERKKCRKEYPINEKKNDESKREEAEERRRAERSSTPGVHTSHCRRLCPNSDRVSGADCNFHSNGKGNAHDGGRNKDRERRRRSRDDCDRESIAHRFSLSRPLCRHARSFRAIEFYEV